MLIFLCYLIFIVASSYLRLVVLNDQVFQALVIIFTVVLLFILWRVIL